ncbi:MAG: PstS family phosphate ABC transporter substrate-binding protein [Sphingobacteriaceae bacterium]
MKTKGISLAVGLLSLLLWGSCQNKNTVQDYTHGQASLVVDESLAPIIEDQLFVFQSAYPEVRVNTLYKPENELLKFFLTDSIRIAVMARTLTPQEAKFYEQKQIRIRVNRFAIDGIALITQKNNPDSLVSVSDVVALMQGKPSAIKNLVFDNPNSSTVRYLKELAKVNSLPSKGVYALKTNPEVIAYVATHPSSIGVVGVNWLVQPDANMTASIDQIKAMGVCKGERKKDATSYFKPTQSDLALGNYPLMRNLYLINCEGGPGPGTGFVSFVAGERGQRIVLKSGLLPDSIPPREVIIRK